MSKIEDYKQARARADAILRAARLASGGSETSWDKNPQNDKAHFACRPTHDDQLAIAAAWGIYGQSAVERLTSNALIRYLAKAITANGTYVLSEAARLAEEDAEAARKAAEDEAREVLAAVTDSSSVAS